MKISENQKIQITQEIVDDIIYNINYRIDVSGSSFLGCKNIINDLSLEWNHNVQRIFEEYQYHITTDIYDDFETESIDDEEIDNYYYDNNEN